MKQCPKCKHLYDDSLSFCLMDGTALTIESEEKTLVISPSTNRKNKKWLWLGFAGIIILMSSGVVMGLLFYSFNRQGESRREKRQTDSNISLSPTIPLKQRDSSTPSSVKGFESENSSSETEELKPTPSEENTEDITPISWDTTASGFSGESGQTYTFRCPENGEEQPVFGSDVYTQDSSICTAAVHAGLISLEDGGIVTIEIRPGRLTYGSTLRNGIKSTTWGEYPRSFVVR